MDIFEFAKTKEQAAHDFYCDLAKKTSDTGITKVFELLAKEEEKHLKMIDKMQSATAIKTTNTTILSDSAEIFKKMRKGVRKFSFEKNELHLYKEAQKIEENSRDFYLEKAEQANLNEHREIFLILAEEEKKHYYLLDNIIEFVSRPQQWLENAEFYHLQEY